MRDRCKHALETIEARRLSGVPSVDVEYVGVGRPSSPGLSAAINRCRTAPLSSGLKQELFCQDDTQPARKIEDGENCLAICDQGRWIRYCRKIAWLDSVPEEQNGVGMVVLT